MKRPASTRRAASAIGSTEGTPPESQSRSRAGTGNPLAVAVKPFSEWSREELDARRSVWQEWSEQHERERVEQRREAAHQRAEARRANKHALVRISRADDIEIDIEQPIRALEIIRRHAKDCAGLPPDWRLLRPTLRIQHLLNDQSEWRHPDAAQLDQRLHMLRQLLPRELDAALNAIMRGMELRAAAREAMAFQLGYAIGHERTISRKTPVLLQNPEVQTGFNPNKSGKPAHGPLRLTLAE